VHLQNAELRPARGLAPDPCVGFSLPIQPARAWYLPWKFAVEWLAAALLAVPSSAVILILAVLVRATSPGKAFYQQKRLGLRGRVFTMVKLRTMAENCEGATGPVWSTEDDPRVTRLGRFLRQTHLDELPQLWNVLRGEMSLIGPRPERPEIAARLAESIPNYLDRIVVRPGLTGLAQVQLPADSNDQTVRRKLAYDRYYAAEIGPVLDLRVALCTCFYLSSLMLKALCHSMVRSYGHAIEQTIIRSELLAEKGAAQTA